MSVHLKELRQIVTWVPAVSFDGQAVEVCCLDRHGEGFGAGKDGAFANETNLGFHSGKRDGVSFRFLPSFKPLSAANTGRDVDCHLVGQFVFSVDFYTVVVNHQPNGLAPFQRDEALQVLFRIQDV